jgi:hypothetical protein
MKRLFQASFSPEIGHSAMNSKWCSRHNCAVEIEMSLEAAALLNFGSSPFILKEGEDKASRQKTRAKVLSLVAISSPMKLVVADDHNFTKRRLSY